MLEELVNFKSYLFQSVSDYGYSLICEPDDVSQVLVGSNSEFASPKFTTVYFDTPQEAYDAVKKDAAILNKQQGKSGYGGGNYYRFIVFKEPDVSDTGDKKFMFSYSLLNLHIAYAANTDRRC